MGQELGVFIEQEKQRQIKNLGEREIFGEISALTDNLPMTSVSAVTDCLLLL